jgi:hypothetical protein
MMKKWSMQNLALAKDYLIEISKDLPEIDEIEQVCKKDSFVNEGQKCSVIPEVIEVSNDEEAQIIGNCSQSVGSMFSKEDQDQVALWRNS